MKVARKRPGEPWEFVEIENTLEALKAEVGGHIRIVNAFSDACIIVNEEGRLRGLPYNVMFRGRKILGTVLLVGVKGGKFCDVPLSNLRILPT